MAATRAGAISRAGGTSRSVLRPSGRRSGSATGRPTPLSAGGHGGAVVSPVDRASKQPPVQRVDGKGAEVVRKAMTDLPEGPGARVHTVTADSGGEFTERAKVAKAPGAGFFATPCHSRVRGLNGHTDGPGQGPVKPESAGFGPVTGKTRSFLADTIVRQKTARLRIFPVNDGIRLAGNHRIWRSGGDFTTICPGIRQSSPSGGPHAQGPRHPAEARCPRHQEDQADREIEGRHPGDPDRPPGPLQRRRDPKATVPASGSAGRGWNR